MEKRQKDDPNFFDYQLDKKGWLEHKLCCDSQSHQDYMDFGGAGV
jgi:hypothetical protein